MARKQPGKRGRFEVFKRDNFTCQYCGNKPPACILEVDHIVPVSKGGGNEKLNLITACFDCNRGKHDKKLENIPVSLVSQIEDLKAKKRQVAAYSRFIAKIKKETDHKVNELGVYWCNYFKEKNKYVFGKSRQVTIRRYLEVLPIEEIFDAIDIAMANVPVKYENDEPTFRYFCGVCKNKVKGGF